MDEAFCFYYQDNLRLLERLGGELVYFSPIHDRSLPEQLDGLILGGGYPELYCEALSLNESMRESVKKAAEGGPSCSGRVRRISLSFGGAGGGRWTDLAHDRRFEGKRI